MANLDEILRVLGESIVAANKAVGDGKPQAGLDMIDVVLATLPAEGLEVVELAALPAKIIALAHLGRPADAQQQLARFENLAASHGSTDDLRACSVLREQIKVFDTGLTARGKAATEAIEAGNPDGIVALETVLGEALQNEQHLLAIGCLTYLGKVYGAVEQPGLSRDRLTRAKTLLEKTRPLDDDRHAIAVGEIDKLLAALPPPG